LSAFFHFAFPVAASLPDRKLTFKIAEVVGNKNQMDVSSLIEHSVLARSRRYDYCSSRTKEGATMVAARVDTKPDEAIF